MKLNIVPARAGATWVRLGIQTFFKQPLALAGLFFMFMAVMTIVSMLPVVGFALAMALLPGATLGLMAATREATLGKFPMPTLLLTAFRAGQQQLRAMLTLGALYAAGFLVALGASWLVDGGDFARAYLGGGMPTQEILQDSSMPAAMLVFMGLHLPLSLLFWHAPALVHWHGMSPGKSLFFSLVACLRNFRAMVLYFMSWMAVLVGVVMVVSLLAALTGYAALAGNLLFPALMIVVSMFFTSLYFSFRDSFEAAEPAATPSTLT